MYFYPSTKYDPPSVSSETTPKLELEDEPTVPPQTSRVFGEVQIPGHCYICAKQVSTAVATNGRRNYAYHLCGWCWARLQRGLGMARYAELNPF